MPAETTDVSTAQTFDVGAFLNNLANTGIGLAAANLSPTRNTGTPSVTTSPSLRTNIGGPSMTVGGMSTQTITYIAIGAAVLVAVIMLAKK